MSTNRVPKGVPTGGQFAPTGRAEADAVALHDDDLAYEGRPEPTEEDLLRARWAGRPFMVSVQPQRWDNDYAIDDGPARQFDLAPVLASMPRAERDNVVSAIYEYGSANNEHGDDLYRRAVALGLVEGHNGPFYVDMHTDDLVEWDSVNAHDDDEMVSILQAKARADLGEAESKFIAARERAHRLELAQAVVNLDYPDDHTIEVLDWSEEPNADGSVDIDLYNVYDAEDNLVGEVETGGAIPAGYEDGTTDWDDFRDETGRVSVGKVRAWVNGGCR